MTNMHKGIAVTIALAAGVLAVAGTLAEAADKNVVANPGGGCERDFANKGGGNGDLTAKGGCDDAMFNDGMRGIAKRHPKPAQQPADDAAASSKSKTETRK